MRRGRPPAWYLVLLAAVGATRLAELALSRRHLRARGVRPAPDDGFRLIVGLHLALFVLPLAEVTALRRRPPGAAPALAALLAASTALRWWSIRSLGRQWSVRAASGSGFQVSERGPYRWIRHPNYLALIGEFFSLPALAGAWLSSLALSAAHAWAISARIRVEERELQTEPGYWERFAGRPRFIPRLLWRGTSAGAGAPR